MFVMFYGTVINVKHCTTHTSLCRTQSHVSRQQVYSPVKLCSLHFSVLTGHCILMQHLRHLTDATVLTWHFNKQTNHEIHKCMYS